MSQQKLLKCDQQSDAICICDFIFEIGQQEKRLVSCAKKVCSVGNQKAPKGLTTTIVTKSLTEKFNLFGQLANDENNIFYSHVHIISQNKV